MCIDEKNHTVHIEYRFVRWQRHVFGENPASVQKYNAMFHRPIQRLSGPGCTR